VWLGNDNGKPMNRAMGGGLPAEIWHQIMDIGHAGKAPLALPGTLRQMPGAADPQTAALPWMPLAARAPRVGRILENLPWLSGPAEPQPSIAMPAQLQAPAVVNASARPRAIVRLTATPEQPAYPRERINENFIAKALAESAADPASRTAADETATPGRLRGMMSLGAWW
jgi:penicillin-binding protein 1A